MHTSSLLSHDSPRCSSTSLSVWKVQNPAWDPESLCVLGLKMKCKCAMANAHSDIWNEMPCYPAGEMDAHWSWVENLSPGWIQRSAAFREMLITRFQSQSMKVFTHKNVFIYSTLAFHGETEARLSHASCITAFSEWLMRTLTGAEAQAVWVWKKPAPFDIGLRTLLHGLYF